MFPAKVTDVDSGYHQIGLTQGLSPVVDCIKDSFEFQSTEVGGVKPIG